MPPEWGLCGRPWLSGQRGVSCKHRTVQRSCSDAGAYVCPDHRGSDAGAYVCPDHRGSDVGAYICPDRSAHHGSDAGTHAGGNGLSYGITFDANAGTRGTVGL